MKETEMEQTKIDPTQVVGWGVDADPENDPTYPMRDVQRGDKGGMNWQRPALQGESVEVLGSSEHNRRTAVFGTSSPPAGLSGAIRRRAFRRSEGKWGHWLMLLMADRINVIEGIIQDLGRGRIPNIPAEMGIRSEIRHNLPGLTRKVMVSGAVLTLAVIGTRALAARRERERAEMAGRSPWVGIDDTYHRAKRRHTR
jgi:hypothetical protein